MTRSLFRRPPNVLIGLLVASTFVTTIAASRWTAFHTTVVKSEPAKGDSVAVAPKVIKLWFSEPLKAGTLEVKLATVGGQAIRLGPPKPDTAVTGDNPPMIIAVLGPMSPAVYRVDWSAVAADGDPGQGNFQFTLRRPKP